MYSRKSQIAPSATAVALAVGITLTSLSAATAHAQSHADTRPAKNALPSQPVYYRGRTPGRRAGEIALWIPRVIFFPLHLVTEYGIRRPIRALIEVTENQRILEYIDKILNPTPNFRWSPTLIANLGVLTSGGVQFWWRDAVIPRNEIAAQAATGGQDFWQFAGRDRYTLDEIYFGILGDFLMRPDRPFYGLGNTSDPEALTYYTQTRGTALGFVGWLPSNHLRLEASGGYRFERMSPGRNPSVETRFDVQTEVPAFGDYLHLFVANANVILDSRPNRAHNTGLRWDARGSYTRDVRDKERHWVSIESDLEAALEVISPGRVLSLSLYGIDTIPLASRPVPVMDQAVLGLFRLPGFLWGRYIDQSAVVATLAYRYPVWEHVDALWTIATGNVFQEHFQNFSFSSFVSSFGVGARSRLDGRDAIEVFLAIGTSRFNQPFSIEGFRLHVGLNPSL
jgi:hypothetical protein